MQILINGKKINYSGPATLTALIAERYPEAVKIAIAINQEFIPKSSYGEVEIKDGDDIEIVAPMQGG